MENRNMLIADPTFTAIHSEKAYQNMQSILSFIDQLPVPHIINDQPEYTEEQLTDLLIDYIKKNFSSDYYQYFAKNLSLVENEHMKPVHEVTDLYSQHYVLGASYILDDKKEHVESIRTAEFKLPIQASYLGHEMIHALSYDLDIDRIKIGDEYSEFLPILYEKMLNEYFTAKINKGIATVDLGKQYRLLNLKQAYPPFEWLNDEFVISKALKENESIEAVYNYYRSYVTPGYQYLLADIYASHVFQLSKTNPIVMMDINKIWSKELTIPVFLDKYHINMENEAVVNNFIQEYVELKQDIKK